MEHFTCIKQVEEAYPPLRFRAKKEVPGDAHSLSLIHILTPELFSEVVHYDVESGEGRAPFSYEITSVAGNRQRVQITGKFEPGRWVFRMTYMLQGAVLQTEDRAILRLRYFSTVSTPIPSTSMKLKLPATLSDGQNHHLIFISETPVNYTFDDNKTCLLYTS